MLPGGRNGSVVNEVIPAEEVKEQGRKHGTIKLFDAPDGNI
jgi:hypothetical protein